MPITLQIPDNGTAGKVKLSVDGEPVEFTSIKLIISDKQDMVELLIEGTDRAAFTHHPWVSNPK